MARRVPPTADRRPAHGDRHRAAEVEAGRHRIGGPCARLPRGKRTPTASGAAAPWQGTGRLHHAGGYGTPLPRDRPAKVQYQRMTLVAHARLYKLPFALSAWWSLLAA